MILSGSTCSITAKTKVTWASHQIVSFKLHHFQETEFKRKYFILFVLDTLYISLTIMRGLCAGSEILQRYLEAACLQAGKKNIKSSSGCSSEFLWKTHWCQPHDSKGFLLYSGLKAPRIVIALDSNSSFVCWVSLFKKQSYPFVYKAKICTRSFSRFYNVYSSFWKEVLSFSYVWHLLICVHQKYRK